MENKIDMKNIKKALEIADTLLCEYCSIYNMCVPNQEQIDREEDLEEKTQMQHVKDMCDIITRATRDMEEYEKRIKINNKKAIETIKEKRKISPYYGRDYKTTLKHYLKDAKKIIELIDSRNISDARKMFKKDKKELAALKSKNLNTILFSFLQQFTKEDIELLDK